MPIVVRYVAFVHKHINLFFLAITVGFFFYLSRVNYPLFHFSVELVGAVISCGIYFITVNMYDAAANGFFLLMGLLSLVVGFFDMLHAFTVQGMFFLDSKRNDVAVQLWVISRYIHSVSLVLAILFRHKKLKYSLLVLLFAVISAVMLLLIHWGIFPACYVMGQGLTYFAIYSEIFVAIVVLIALWLVIKNEEDLPLQGSYYYFAWALVFIVARELSFAIYSDLFDSTQVLSHLLKLMGCYCIYKALITGTLHHAKSRLFDELYTENQKYIYLINHDELTGVYNRYFFQQLTAKLTEYHPQQLGVLICEVDCLTHINKIFGYDHGNRIIKDCAKIIRRACRKEDFIMRIDGKRFIVIMENTDADYAADLYKNIQLHVANYNIPQNQFLGVTMGFAVSQDKNDVMEGLFSQAESMVFKCKPANREKLLKILARAEDKRHA